jgi:hypothetical protein
MPCHDHAVLKGTSQGHGTAQLGHGMACVNEHRPSRDGMWVTCPRSTSFGYHAEFHEVCYQKHTAPLNCGTSSSDFSSYHADFHEDMALSENGMFELTRHGMAGEWHECGMAHVNQP